MVQTCSTTAPPENQAAMLEAARRLLSGSPAPRALQDATETLQQHASSLWKGVSPDCTAEARDVLAPVMARLEP